MKNLIALLIVLVLGSSAIIAKEINPKTQLRNEVASLLQRPIIKVDKQEVNAVIEFTINSQNELVVINVSSERKEVAEFVKQRLNYHKLSTVKMQKGKDFYRISLKVVPAV